MCKYVKLFLLILLQIVLISRSEAVEPNIVDYTAYPPSVSQQFTPNVLVLLDNSGSMNEFAYKDFDVSKSRGVPLQSSYYGCGGVACDCDYIFTNGYSGYGSDCPDDSYDPNKEYYGYFNPDKPYSYSTAAGGNFYEDTGTPGSWDGNFLNWLSMRRVDVIKRVLVGGKAVNRGNPSTAKYLIGADNPDRNQFKEIADSSPYTPFTGQRCFYISAGEINVIKSGSCSDYFYDYDSNIDGTYNLKVEVGDDEPTGVVQKTWDRIRFGLMYFNYGNAFESTGGSGDGGHIADWISGPGANVNLVTSVENTDPSTWTPLGEALYEATRFFRLNSSAYQNDNYSAHDPIQSECQKNFVLILTDGESTKDRNIPGGNWSSGADPAVTKVTDDDFDVKTYMDLIATNEGYTSQWGTDANSMEGTYYLEGVAYWAHISDLRCGVGDFEGTQNLTTYVVFAFDESLVGKDLSKKTAKYGGFKDYNYNDIPDLQSEWDEDGDNVPDTYFEADEGASLEASIIQALTDILRRASSSTAVSVLANSGEGDGAVYQAYYFPEKMEDVESRNWLGYLHALFVDKYGNLREDSDGDKALNMQNDYIIEMVYDPDTGTKLNKYIDSNGDGKKDSNTPSFIGTLDSVNTLWKGGEKLWETDPANRTVFTSIDGYTKVDFETTNSLTLQPYLRAADTSESDNIINWIRGDDLTGITDSGHPNGYRKRDITINNVNNVWKLGDIVYSTPTFVGRPMENYDLLYGDSSFYAFRSKYLKRRQVVYAGANDGMLHAFNAGCFKEAELKFYPDVDSNGNCTTGAHSLGEELWAFIPRGLLPHLKWNTMIEYTHVYYVDLKPKIVDVNIFTADTATHINGWGTVLIGGFRYGGKDISWTSGSDSYSASPEYFALDITDPLNPRLLWTFSDPGLGLSMTYPSVARVCNTSCKWFAIFGSGATDYDTNSNLTAFQAGNLFVLEISGGTNGVIDTWTEDVNFWKISTGNSSTFMADPITVDVDLDYDVDVIYFGENYSLASNWNALLHRITTNQGTQISPADWTISTLGDIEDIGNITGGNDVVKRITSAPSVAKDGLSNLWVFFGTGQYYGSLDKNQTDTGAFYAIKDGCWEGGTGCSTSYTNLMNMSSASVYANGTVNVGGTGYASWPSFLTASYEYDGWAIYFGSLGENVDFTGASLTNSAGTHAGERLFSKPLVLGGLVLWSTYIPGIDECSYEGDSNIYVVYYETGSANNNYVFKEQKDAADAIADAEADKLKAIADDDLDAIDDADTRIANIKAIYDLDEVARVKRLGKGMPSSISAHITSSGTMKGFAQLSTGSILEIEANAPVMLKSTVKGWKSQQIP